MLIVSGSLIVAGGIGGNVSLRLVCMFCVRVVDVGHGVGLACSVPCFTLAVFLHFALAVLPLPCYVCWVAPLCMRALGALCGWCGFRCFLCHEASVVPAGFVSEVPAFGS